MLPSALNKLQNNTYTAWFYQPNMMDQFFGLKGAGTMNGITIMPSHKPNGDLYTDADFKLGRTFARFNDADLRKKCYKYNGNGDYESKTVFDFGFQDYNGLYGTDFPVLPPDVGGSRTFQTITRTKNRKVVLLCETATEQSLTVQLYVATEESSHSDALDALFPDGCLEETFDGVSVEYFGETALPLTAARFRINRDDVFLVLRQSDSLELLFNILKEII